MIRLDFIFSYWIYAWYILFIIGIIPYNPGIILFVGFCFIIIETMYLLYYGANRYNVQKYLTINIILKIMPLLILWWQNKLSVKPDDIYFTIGLFILYIIYLQLNGTHIVEVYNEIVKSYYKDDYKEKTIVSKTYDYLYNKFQ